MSVPHLAASVNALLAARWEESGGKVDTTMEIEHRRGTHWLIKPVNTRPSISTFLKTVLRIRDWNQMDMSRKAGMNICNVQRLVSGGQQSCAPETKAKFRRLVEDDTYLLDLFNATDWGLVAEPNRTLAKEKMRRRM